MTLLSMTLRLGFFSLHEKNKIAAKLDTEFASVLFCPEKYFCILSKQAFPPKDFA